jgi:CRP/FNR family transcriptional regulator
MVVQVELLKSIPYFSGLGPAEFDSIKEFIFERAAEKGELLLLEGESGGALYFVASGAVKCFKTSKEGKEQILRIALPGIPSAMWPFSMAGIIPLAPRL